MAYLVIYVADGCSLDEFLPFTFGRHAPDLHPGIVQGLEYPASGGHLAEFGHQLGKVISLGAQFTGPVLSNVVNILQGYPGMVKADATELRDELNSFLNLNKFLF